MDDSSMYTGLDPEDLDVEREIAWDRFSSVLSEFVKLEQLGKVVVVVDVDRGRHVPSWDRVQSAYHGLRELFVSSPGKRRIKSKARPAGDPHTRALILQWCSDITNFRQTFYGPETPAEIRDVVLLYRRKWSKWHKQSDRYKDRHRVYMKKYMAEKRAKAKAAQS